MASRSKVFFTLGILILLFVGPMIAAWSLYSAKNPWIEETTNYGFLITPPVDLSQMNWTLLNDKKNSTINFQGIWTMLYVQTSSCTEACQNNLYKMRQIWLALGKNMDRVQRVMLTFSNVKDRQLNTLLSKDYIGTLLIAANQRRLDQTFGQIQKNTHRVFSFYLIDPHGNLMMAYAADADPEGMLADLTKLLRVSQIG